MKLGTWLIAATTLGGASMPAAAAVDMSTLVQWKVENGGNGHWYALTDSRTSWTVANAAATAAGGHLASINSAAENAFIGTAFGFTRSVDTIYWIGLKRTAANGPFAWTDGSELTYTNWNPGEPNNDRGLENYAALNWYAPNVSGGRFGTWNDTPDEGVIFANPTPQPYRGVVEFTSLPGAVPEPASWAMMIGGFGLVGGVLRKRSTVRFA